MMRYLGWLPGVAAIAAAGVAQAHDGDRYARDQVVVPSAGLDLSTPAGVDILAARLDRAVRQICGWDRRCQDEAWASTEWQVARAIDKARRWRELAQERAAQLRACGGHCTQPARWYAPPPPATTVIVIRH